MALPKLRTYQVGDAIKTFTGWKGVIVKKLMKHNGYRIRWTDTLNHQFKHAGDTSDMTQLNFEPSTK